MDPRNNPWNTPRFGSQVNNHRSSKSGLCKSANQWSGPRESWIQTIWDLELDRNNSRIIPNSGAQIHNSQINCMDCSSWQNEMIGNHFLNHLGRNYTYEVESQVSGTNPNPRSSGIVYVILPNIHKPDTDMIQYSQITQGYRIYGFLLRSLWVTKPGIPICYSWAKSQNPNPS